ncbi:cysteine desulfurase [Acholeplasma equirhinis]|uniref:aminotransferase class V-fold PLP-dependent enzyme n=1 Tax=Acholeplasma equirhinis TaxID=555393 RepID=UPI00197AA621|nr:cysteine desulfurase [Acholeplasma equirhinis]MBN3491151.1 cysteine desulfurase [Acholeplasma equirhinis]
MLNVDRIRKQFPIYKKYPDMAFFDSAASSLKPKVVIDAMYDYLAYNGTNVHRGVYELASIATELYEGARGDIAGFINAEQDEIIFTKSTTHGLNMLARGMDDLFEPGDEIVISELEHHSNLLPWLDLSYRKQLVVKFIPLDNGKITIENFKKVLSKKTKLVVTHHISNVMGYITPIEKMIKLASKVGAMTVLDAAQSIAHLPIDVKKMDCDFLVFSGHKMYGPNGIGVLYGKRSSIAKVNPSEFGGEMVDKVKLEGSSFKALPYNFEAGTPAIAEAIGLRESVKFLKKIGLKKIHQHELELKKYILEKLENEADIEIFNKASDSGLITFNIKDLHPHDTASFLDQYKVAVRAGHHCNQLTMKYLNQVATVRLSIGIYNNFADCDKFVEAILATRDFFKSL